MAAVPQTCCYTKVVCSTSARLFHIYPHMTKNSTAVKKRIILEWFWISLKQCPNSHNHQNGSTQSSQSLQSLIHICHNASGEKSADCFETGCILETWCPGDCTGGKRLSSKPHFFKICFTDIYRLCIHHFICFIDLTVYASLWQYNVPCLGWKLGYLSFLLLSSYLTGCIWFSLSTPRCRFDKLYLIPYFG